MPGIASAATAVVIGHVAAATTTMRIGAGGIMLPNHAPLMVAEQFGTLATLYPGRIDLGLGRAPGTDGATDTCSNGATDEGSSSSSGCTTHEGVVGGMTSASNQEQTGGKDGGGGE